MTKKRTDRIIRRRDYLDLDPHPLHLDKPRKMKLRLTLWGLYLIAILASMSLGFYYGSR